MTLPLINAFLAEWFNSDKENGNDENIKGVLHARIQARGSPAGGQRPKHRGGGAHTGLAGLQRPGDDGPGVVEL